MFKQLCFRLLLLASAIATSLSAAAYSFESAGIYYNITGDNTVEVTYSDRDNNTYSGSISVPETVTNNGTEYSVTTIGESAFKGSAVTSVSMPEGITIIGFEAFSGCQNLESVALPESLTTLGIRTFGGCQSLKTIKIPSGVRAIPSSCFNGCSSLESVTIPEGVTSIEGSAFWSCNLNALTLPESLETIGSYAFCNNCVLKSVNIPAKVKTIESDAFYNCGLTELVIPEEVQTIDNYAFCNNPLKKLTLPSTITSIGSGAFLNNYSLQSITCNATTPPSLGENAFNHNISTTVKVPLSSIAAYRQAEGWKNFTNYYGGEVIADGITYRIDENDAMVAAAEATLTEANIPSSVEFEGNQYPVIKINDRVFSGNTNLTSVTLPESLTTLGDRAFSCCDKLENISLPVSVKQIEEHAFVGSGLKTIKLFGEVTSIEEYAFADCFSLTDFYCYSDNSPQTEENVFANVDLNKVNLHVPCNRKDAYTGADYWRDFGHIFTTDEVKQDGLWYRLDDNTWEAALINNPDGNSRIIYEGDIVIPTDIGFSHANYDVTSIGVRAFEYSNITSVSIPKSVVSIGTSAFVGCPFTSIDIPNTVTAIGAYTFAGCSNLKSVILPNSLETIEGGLFSDCTNLESVKIPNTVTSIRHSAFQYCCNLESIIIPSSVNSIGISAFSECKALKDIYCQAVNVPETHSSAFNNSPIEKMTLYVPGESMNAYKTTAPWSGFGKFQTLTTGIEKTETAAKLMITTADGQIAVSGLSGNASIQVLSLDGKLLDSTNATDGIATLNAQPGEVVIVKVGTESYKVVVR